jgi:hypothetical protein
LAKDYGMTDMNSVSHSRVNRAMPWSRGLHAQPDRSLGIKHFAPGFSAHFHPTYPTCSPSETPVNIRGKKIVGQALARSGSIPGPSVNTKIEGRYYPNPSGRPQGA